VRRQNSPCLLARTPRLFRAAIGRTERTNDSNQDQDGIPEEKEHLFPLARCRYQNKLWLSPPKPTSRTAAAGEAGDSFPWFEPTW